MSLVSGLASMASGMAASPVSSPRPSIVSLTTVPFTTTVLGTPTVTTAPVPTATSVVSSATPISAISSLAPGTPAVSSTQAGVPTTSMPPSVSAALSISTGAGIPTHAYARRASKPVTQKSLEKIRLRDEFNKDNRRPRDQSRDRNYRKEEERQTRSASICVPAARRASTRGPFDESILPKPIETQKNSLEDHGGSEEATNEEPPMEGVRRGRRRSIVRQKSYDEDGGEDPGLLWVGNLPARRHSSQDPTRRTDGPPNQRDSLDVPQGRVIRHHSWDYDVGRDSLLPG